MPSPADTTSLLLLDFVASGRPESFRQIDERYRPILEGLGRRAGLQADGAEDLAQETLIRLAQNATRFDPERAKLKTWMFGIARRCLNEAFRTRQKQAGWRGDSIVQELAEEPVVSTMWERACEAEILRRAIEELRTTRTDARTVDAFERFAVKGETAEDIARSLEMTVEQVYVAKSRCLVKLRPIVETLRSLYELD